jgi:signal transduction histidine kinase
MPLLHRFASYGATILACAFALLLRCLFRPLFDEQASLLVLIAVIMFSAWYGGPGPGIFATGLGILAIIAWSLPPFAGLTTTHRVSMTMLGIFALEGLFISVLSGALHNSITERKQAEARLRLLVDQLPVILWTTDTDLRLTSSHGAGLAQLAPETTGYQESTFGADPTAPITAQQCGLQGEPLHDGAGALDITARNQDTEALQRFRVRLQILHTIDQAMLAAHTSDAIAAAALLQLRHLVAFDQADLLMFDRAANVAHVLATLGVASALTVGDRLPLDDFKAACGDTWDADHSATSTLAHGLMAILPTALRATGMQSHLCAPLIAQQTIVGMLILQVLRPIAFSSEAFDIVREIGTRLALSVRQTQLFEQVHAGRTRLQALSGRLVEVQEAERRQIARELHDEIGQELTGLKFLLEMAEHSVHIGQGAKLHEAHMLVANLMARVRELSLNLRPPMLDDLGLLPALIWHFDRYTAQTGIRVSFHHDGIGRRFLSAIETAAYRIIQEALTNIARYADVCDATIVVCLDDGVLRLEVADRGRGFDPQTVLHAHTSNGLTSMHERAVLAGGTLTLESTPGAGTRLVTTLPVDSRTERQSQERS